MIVVKNLVSDYDYGNYLFNSGNDWYVNIPFQNKLDDGSYYIISSMYNDEYYLVSENISDVSWI